MAGIGATGRPLADDLTVEPERHGGLQRPGQHRVPGGLRALSPGDYDGLLHVSYNAGASGFDFPVRPAPLPTRFSAAFIPQEAGGYTGASWYDPLAGGTPLALCNNSLVQVPCPSP